MLGKKKTFSVVLAERGGASYSVDDIPDCAGTRLLGGIASGLTAERAHLIKRVAELEATCRGQLDRLMEAQQRAAAAEKKIQDAEQEAADIRTTYAEQEAADIRTTYAAMARKPQTIRNGAGWDDVVTPPWAWPRLGLNSDPAVKPVHAPVDVYVITDKDIVLEIAGLHGAGAEAQEAAAWQRLYRLGVPVTPGERRSLLITDGIVYAGPGNPVPEGAQIRYHYLAVPKKGGRGCRK